MFNIELLQPPKNNIQSGGYLFNNQIALFLQRKGIGKLVEVESVNLIEYISIKYRKNIMSRMTFNSKEWSSDKIYGRKFTNKIRFINTKDSKQLNFNKYFG